MEKISSDRNRKLLEAMNAINRCFMGKQHGNPNPEDYQKMVELLAELSAEEIEILLYLSAEQIDRLFSSGSDEKREQ